MSHRLRVKAALIHLAVSAVIASTIGALILGVWFPGSYAKVAHGWQLLAIILCVDSVCGPLLTLVLFNPRKSRRELTLDMSLVVLIQLAALAYGVHAALQARPVLTVFEADRFRVVSAVEVDPERLQEAAPELRTLPFDGPRVIGVRIPHGSDPDFGQAIVQEVSFQPKFWRSFDSQRDAARRVSRPLSTLRAKHPGEASAIDGAIAATGLPEADLKFLPLQTRRNDNWVVLVRASDAGIVGFLPLDGF